MASAIQPATTSPHHQNPPQRRRILVCVPRYLPGYKSGGPIRAIANMIANMSGSFEFFVLTRDRDATDEVPFPGIHQGKWNQVGAARVLYCSSIVPEVILQAVQEVRPDLIHLNSYQDTFTRIAVRLRRAGKLGDIPVLIAPRGEFSPGAMRIKRVKKFIYRHLAKALGFYDGVCWQASSSLESRDLLAASPARRITPRSVHVAHEFFDGVVSDLPHPQKRSGDLKLIFVSRISEKKNLHFLLEVLRRLKGNISLDIFGPVAEKDARYWARCLALLQKLPGNLQASYRGPIDHAEVPDALHRYHFFVLPTQGENYCHAAVESIINGTPVILSDATPWIGLAKAHAGFDLPLSSRTGWISALESCVNMGPQEYAKYLGGIQEYGRRFSVAQAMQEHNAMFMAALNVAL